MWPMHAHAHAHADLRLVEALGRHERLGLESRAVEHEQAEHKHRDLGARDRHVVHVVRELLVRPEVEVGAEHDADAEDGGDRLDHGVGDELADEDEARLAGEDTEIMGRLWGEYGEMMRT